MPINDWTYIRQKWVTGEYDGADQVIEMLQEYEDRRISRTATVVVAASDASEKSKTQADYVCDGVDDQVEIQAAIDSLPSGGGKVVLTEGNYSIGSSIIIKGSYIVIEGQGMGVTTLTLANNVNDCLIKSDLSAIHDLCVIRNMTLRGNKSNQSSGHGVNATGLRKSTLENLWIENFKQDGIYANEDDGVSAGLAAGNSDNVNLYYCIITNNDDDGVHLQGSSGFYITRTWCVSNGNRGFFFYGKGDQQVDLYAEDNDHEGVYLQGLGNLQGWIWAKSNADTGLFCSGIDSCTLFILLENNSDQHAHQEMYLGNVTKSYISGKIHNSLTSGGGRQGIKLQSYDGVTVDAVLNLLIDVTGYGLQFISEGTASFEITYVGGSINATEGAIQDNGVDLSSCIIRYNRNYVTENSGTATITAGDTSVNVSHGLASTPTRVYLTPTTDTAGKRYWVSNKGSSTFTITIDSSHTADISFDWKAEM